MCRSVNILAPVSFLLCATLASGAWGASKSDSQVGSANLLVFTGSPVFAQTFTAHIKGAEIQLFEVVADFHAMNNPYGRQPVDLQFHFPIMIDLQSGHFAYCQTAFAQVVSDQEIFTSGDRTFPYLQVNIDEGYPTVLTDEGILAYADRSIACWEVLDPVAPPVSN